MPLMSNCRQKIYNTLYISFRYCKDIADLLFWVLWTCLAIQTQSDTMKLQKTFVFICRQKINFIPQVFLEILQRYANLFWALWACMAMYTQNDKISLQQTSIFICMPKINFITSFLRQFDWPTTFWPITREPEICQIWDWQ